MNWYNVRLEQRDGPKLNGHLRAATAADAIRTALGKDRRWPITEAGTHQAHAVDPGDPGNWCRARQVDRPVAGAAASQSGKKRSGTLAKPRSAARTKEGAVAPTQAKASSEKAQPPAKAPAAKRKVAAKPRSKAASVQPTSRGGKKSAKARAGAAKAPKKAKKTGRA